MFKITSPRGTKSAFTLIELLVVIAIIAILAAILFPVFGRARENARKTSCLSNLKQIGLGITQYSQDYDERMPAAGHMLLRQTGQTDNNMQTKGSFHQTIYPYTKSRQVYACASNDASKNTLNDSKSEWAGISIPDGIPVSYMANAYATGVSAWAASGTPMAVITSTTGTTRVLAQLVTPAQSIMVFENTGSSRIPDMWDNTDMEGGGPANRRVLLTEHMSMSNFLFADGHVKTMKPVMTIAGANMWSNNAEDPVTPRLKNFMPILQANMDK